MNKKIRLLQTQKANHLRDWRATLDLAAKENREPTAEEVEKVAGLQASIESINAKIKAEETLLALEADSGLDIPDNARIEGGEPSAAKDKKHGFRSFGEFAASVRRAAQPGAQRDERLNIGAAAPGTFSNEASGSDGGFAVPPQFSTDIWRLSLGEGSLIPMTQNTEVTSNSMSFPKDETTPWGGTGVQAYWRAEAALLQASKLALGDSLLRLNELIVLLPVTNELLDDAPALGSYMEPIAAERIQWKSNEAILFGTGAGQPKGALAANNGSLLIQAKDAGQAAGTLTNSNISNMVSRLLAGQLMNSIWMGNPDILPALEGMQVGNYPIYLPNNNVSGASYGMLKGRPLMMSEHAFGLGQQSDLSLLSLKGYRTLTKASGIETATSMHIYFDANVMAFRWIFRLAGEPIMSAPIAPPPTKGSKSRSYFVTLASRQ